MRDMSDEQQRENESHDEWLTRRNTERLDHMERQLVKGIQDQTELRHEVAGLRKALEAIQSTLTNMASDEIAELKHRAELPKRILYAVLIPVLVAVVTALVGSAVAGVHF
jgi:hypothetical protein